MSEEKVNKHRVVFIAVLFILWYTTFFHTYWFDVVEW